MENGEFENNISESFHDSSEGEMVSPVATTTEPHTEEEAGVKPSDAIAQEDTLSPETVAQLESASQPFIGRWNQLISSTNWEKGRIISDWRNSLVAQGAPATEYSDEAWARRVGGVTAPHIGRLRRVFDRFGSQYESYPGLYWSHFLSALDWDDAELWLEGAMRSGWSVSQMRDQKWQASGAAEENRPNTAEIITADLDEDVVMPAQGGGKEGRFEDNPDGVTAGPVSEGSDFGDEPEEDWSGETVPSGSGAGENENENLSGEGSPSLIQPFAGLPELPPDLSEALEMFKLAIVRHKASGWRDTTSDVVLKALDGLKLLVTARSE